MILASISIALTSNASLAAFAWVNLAVTGFDRCTECCYTPSSDIKTPLPWNRTEALSTGGRVPYGGGSRNNRNIAPEGRYFLVTKYIT